MKKTILSIAIAATATLATVGTSVACTTAAYNNGDVAISMRTMDWYGNDQATVIGSGKGISNSYSETNGVQTHSKYATLSIKSFAPGLVAEGLNEKGLEGHLLYLGTDAGTQFPQDSAQKQNVDAGNVIRFAIDNFATVPELIAGLKQVDVLGTEVCDLPNHEGECIYPPVHYMFADAQGNTAVVEFINGEMRVHDGEGSNVMSNNPAFEYHLEQDKDKVQPDGTIRPADRRLRAKQILEDMHKREVTDLDKAKISMKAAGATVFAGINQEDPYAGGIYPTLWTTYLDRNNGELVLDRHDTWAVEQYNFSMFDTNKAEVTELGTHPTFRD